MPRGATPGERRGGRAKGTPNRYGPDIRYLAGKYANLCVEQLVRIATKSKIEVNRLGAISQLLDRAYGKPAQALTGDPDLPVHLKITWEK